MITSKTGINISMEKVVFQPRLFDNRTFIVTAPVSKNGQIGE